LSVLKSLDIDLPQSEKKTLFRFLSLYLFFTILTISLISSIYYNLQNELLVKQRTIVLNQYANEFIMQLKELKDKDNYPRDNTFKTSLYDKNYNLIFSTLSHPKEQLDQISYTDNKIIRYIKNTKEYYENTQYVIIEINNPVLLNDTIRTIALYSLIFFILMMIMGYYLLDIFLRPMKEALHLLDTFIKDTTHELNTPVSTILTNIELLNQHKIENENIKKSVNRIDIGAKTISNIYNDLTFLILNNKIISNNENVNLQNMLLERIEYFSTIAKMKRIVIKHTLEDNIILNIDRNKISKLLENLISNAINYNTVSGVIDISLDENQIVIQDTGRGIKEEDIESIFDRYSRFDKSAGGFGIGLNIVKLICDEYGLKIKIESKINLGTKVIINITSTL
jgi:two-component system OmpR family sensor kinase